MLSRLLFILTVSLLPAISTWAEHTASEIGQKLYAVHATNILPKEDHVIRAGFRRKPFLDPVAATLFPDIRDTVHFALGEVVRAIKVGDKVYDWESSPYAIITPLEHLFPQLININTYDTFTLGSVAIDQENFTVIVPDTEVNALPAKHKYEVLTYDPRVMKIREAVDHVLHDKQGWAVRMTADHTEDQLSPGFLNDTEIDINNAEFFSPLKEIFPHISIVGLRWDAFEGQGYQFGVMELKLIPLVKYMLTPSFELVPGTGPVPSFNGPDELEAALDEVQRLAAAIDQFVADAPYSSAVKLEYDDKRFLLQSWIHILTIELELNRNVSKTLRGASSNIWKEIDLSKHSLEELRSVLFAQLDQLPSYSQTAQPELLLQTK